MKHPGAGRYPPSFTIRRAQGQIVDVVTDSPEVTHFLRLVRLNRSYHTWLNYSLDLKTFFTTTQASLDSINRAVCASFIEQQRVLGRADATINRRLAALSSLFAELQLLDPVRFPTNPVIPLQRGQEGRRRSMSLYRQQAQRIPTILSEAELRAFLEILPTWRDRTLVLLMCLSCLRVSEVVAIRFGDVECSRRSVFVAAGKGQRSRTTFMDSTTFSALNRYLDHERGLLFPDQEALFVGFKGRRRGQALSINAVQHLVSYYAPKAGIPALHPHRFRHTGITWLLERGMDEPALRTMVGHRSPRSMEPYTHLRDTVVQQAFEQAAPALQLQYWLGESR